MYEIGDAGQASTLRKVVSGFVPALEIDAASSLPMPPYAAYRLIVLLNPDRPGLGAARAEGLRSWTRDGGRLLISGGEDGLVTLESLPGVIQEAVDTGQLVITSHVSDD